MRTPRTTRVTFSDDRRTLDITLPKGWAECSDGELRALYRALSAIPGADRATALLAAFRALTGMRVIRESAGRFLAVFRADDGAKVRLLLTPEEMAGHLEALAWTEEPGTIPARYAEWAPRRHRWSRPSPAAAHPLLRGVSFGDYLRLENLYQGYIATLSPEPLRAMAAILYPGLQPPAQLRPDQVMNLTMWMVQVKGRLSEEFPDLFRPAAPGGPPPDMLRIMNNEIRALTGGDLTLEPAVLEADCWRALTELDFKAREADEIKRELSKHRT